MTSALKKGLCFTVVSLLISGLLFAQSERGTIRGTVTDSSGSVMPGVTVKAMNVDTEIETPTRDHGFRLIQHPPSQPGNYIVEAERTGFKKLIARKRHGGDFGNCRIRSPIGSRRDKPGSFGDDAAPQLKSETSEVATGISPKAFLDLPLNRGRWSICRVIHLPGSWSDGKHVRCAHQRQPDLVEGNSARRA